MSVALVLLAACSSSSATTIEDLPNRYHRALADEDWSQAWDMFSADAKRLCTFDFFLESRQWFKENSGDGYDFYLSRFKEFSEGEWEVETSEDTTTLTLPGEELWLEAVPEDGGWRIADSGEYDICLPFRP